MKSIALRRLALATAGLTVLTGVALAGGPDHGPGMQGMAMPMNVAEMTQKAQEHAAAVDLDKDGFVTPAETRAYREQQREARAAAKFARMDANKDGKVSVAEFSAEHTARIQAMDANGDFVVTWESAGQDGSTGGGGVEYRASTDDGSVAEPVDDRF